MLKSTPLGVIMNSVDRQLPKVSLLESLTDSSMRGLLLSALDLAREAVSLDTANDGRRALVKYTESVWLLRELLERIRAGGGHARNCKIYATREEQRHEENKIQDITSSSPFGLPSSSVYGLPPIPGQPIGGAYQPPFTSSSYYPPQGPAQSFYPPPSGQYHPPLPTGPRPGYPAPPVPVPYSQQLPPPITTSTYPGAPQQFHASALWYLGTEVPNIFISVDHIVPGYNPAGDAENIRNATKGFGTNDDLLISTLAPLSAMKMQAVSNRFVAAYGLQLIDVLDKESTFNFKYVNSPSSLYEDQTQSVLSWYKSIPTMLMINSVFLMALSSDRSPDTAPVDHAHVAHDVDALYAAGEKRFGTDEVGANPKYDQPSIYRDAKLIHDAMKGFGTRDHELIWRPMATLNDKQVQQNQEFWFSDGSIVLVIEDVAFCVHKSILGKHSKVFSDLFMVPQPQNGVEKIGDIPVVHLADDLGDFTDVLRALYEPLSVQFSQTFQSELLTILDVSSYFDKLSHDADLPAIMQFVSGILRISTKYDIVVLRDKCISILRRIFPSSLSDCDILLSSKYSYNASSIVRAIPLAREANIPEILPWAFYVSTSIPNDTLLNDTVLSWQDKALCLVGKEKLWELQKSLTHRFLFESTRNPACQLLCQVRHPQLMSWHRMEELRAMAHPLEPFCDWNSFKVCPRCMEYAKLQHKNGREKVWEDLPSIFHLGKWNDLVAEQNR
ncbi:hypothetical protein C0993_007241 [Termitomyces sp. T159_Od127]|nr:hypothetical protein C0993_007241 [Termitomyces sp. T159_Od127]